VSTDPGGKEWAQGAVADAKALVADAAGLTAEQLQFLPSPEDMQDAERFLRQDTRRGPQQSEVLAEARRRAGRKPGSRNRRTDDFARYILGFGQHPAVTMMQIQSTPPETLVERSAAMDPAKRRLSYGDAQALRIRCAEALLPYIEGKKPVAVDISVNGDYNLLIPGLNISEADARMAADGQFVFDADFSEIDEGDGQNG
jgi:hypothetical protein